MDCHEFERRLGDYLDGTLPEGERREAAGHLDHCDRCRSLVLPFAEAESGPGPALSDAIVDEVLRRTTGPACVRAETRLVDLVDRDLGRDDADLLSTHLAHCPRCADLATTLAWTAEVLPRMASVPVDAAFVAGVMEATVAARRGPGWIEAIREAWTRALRRPGFTMEVAYVAMVLLALVFGLSGPAVREVPSQVLALAQSNPVHAARSLAGEGTWLRESTSRVAGDAWSRTGGQVHDRVWAGPGGLSGRLDRMGSSLASLRDDTGGLLQATFRGDVVGVAVQLEQVGGDLHRLWTSATRGVAASSDGED